MGPTGLLGTFISRPGEMQLGETAEALHSIAGAATLPLVETNGHVMWAEYKGIGEVTLTLLQPGGRLQPVVMVGAGAATLPFLSAAGSIERYTRWVGGNTRLLLLSAAGAIEHADTLAQGTVTLPLLGAAGDLQPLNHAVEGAVTLPLVRASGDLSTPNTIQGAISLPLVVGGGTLRIVDQWTIAGAVRLPRLKPKGYLRAGGFIYSITGEVRAGGCAMLCFLGPQNRVIEWSIQDGGGTLFPVDFYTDAWGRALCRYESGGWTGPVVIRVTYGT